MTRNFQNIALIVAAGKGERISTEIPKQYLTINGKTLLEITINKFLSHPYIDAVAVVISKNQEDLYKKNPHHDKLLNPIYGGNRRQDSVRLGLDAIEKYNPQKVLIHDAARIFITEENISQLIKALDTNLAACLVSPATDTMRDIKAKSQIVPRETLYHTQTPQAFHYEFIKNLHHQFKVEDVTDDISLMEHAKNYDIEYIQCSKSNFKITTQEDYDLAKKIMTKQHTTRIGMGFDAHKFQKTDKDNSIMLCGLAVPSKYEIIAHSDGDVALHALTDALLGTIGEGDIGVHFPPTDAKWKNAASDQFVQHAYQLIKNKNGYINNIDLTIISQTPKILPYREKMRQKIATLLEINISQVSIKATTTEGMGFTGRREGIACQAIVAITCET